MPRADAVPALLAFALVVALGFDQGGYAPASWVWSTALLGLVAGLLLTRRAVRPSRLELVFVAALAALLAWSLFSALWSLDPTASVLEAERLLLYVATAAALLLVAGPRSRTGMLAGVLAASTALCLAGLADVLVGDDPIGAATADPGSEDRLSEPIGYANALGLLAAMGILLAAGLAAVAERPALRAACLAPVPALLATLYLTYSRGAWLALALGFVAVAAMRVRAIDRRIAIPLGVAALAAVAVAGARAVDSFSSPTTTPAQGSTRLLTLSGSSRSDYWRVAGRAIRDEPLLGAGAGGYGRYWLRHRPVPQPALDAHSLYLETVAELGPIGLVLLLAALGAPVAAAVGARDDPLAPAALGPYAAYLAHAAQDWDWELPAVTVAALVCAVCLLRTTPRRRLSHAVPARAAVGGAAAAFAGLALAAYAGNRELALGEAGSERSARRAARLQPWSAAPWRALGEAQLARGAVGPARVSFREGLERDEGDWELWLELALATEGAERASALARAAELNPRAPDVEEVSRDG